MNRLARAADVSRDLLSSLEDGNAHTTHKVMAVFNVLEQLHRGVLRVEDELCSTTDTVKGT